MNKISQFQNLISNALVPLIDRDYVLLDVPNHCNIGDNLIWEGELQFLGSIKDKRCIYTANVLNWEEEKIDKPQLILFHGGGNWGDLYRECQEHRIYITKKYHDKRIIVFPQTVCYQNVDLLEQDCKIFNEHPDIHICLRDKLSYDTLSRYISREKLLLLPDMAFFVNIPNDLEKGNRKLYMLRTDPEADNTIQLEVNNADIKDWPTYSNNKLIYNVRNWLTYRCKIMSVKLQRFSLTKWIVSPVYGLNSRNSRERYVTKGIKFFERYGTIYTTRLHGLILGVLMGKKIIIIDNKYNKCRNFYYTWLKDFENVTIYSNTVCQK